MSQKAVFNDSGIIGRTTTMNAISIPDVLYKHLMMIAEQQEEGLEVLVQRVLERYLSDLKVPKGNQETGDQAALTNLLKKARAEYRTSGELWLDWEGIEREVANRRGGTSERKHDTHLC